MSSEQSSARVLPQPAGPVHPVVVIDDDVLHGDSLVALLDMEGYAASSFSDPVVGLEAVLQSPPTVLILDLDMPGISGIDLLARLQSAGIGTKTIVLTGTQDFGVVGDIVRLGAYDFLSKPATPSRLLATLGRAVAMTVLERESEANAAAAQRSNRLHEFLVQATPDLVYMLDSSGKFTYLNNKLKEVFQLNSESLLGQHWSSLFDGQQTRIGPEHDPAEHATLIELLHRRFDERRGAARSTSDLEFDLVPQSGPHRGETWTLQVTSTGLYSDDQPPRFTGTYGIIRNITSRRRAERDRLELQAQIQQASKMEAMGQLAGGIAHDFNNILASMIGYAELVQSAHERLASDALESYLEEVVTAGHRARDLIAQMLTFTRTSRSEPQPVSVVEVIDNVSRMLRAAIPSSIQIQTRFDPELPDALADKIQLQQVLLNLVINARDAITGTGRIDINLSRNVDEGQHCHVCGDPIAHSALAMSVADTGHGIPEEIRERIFEMYFTTRDGETTGTSSSGTGLGLWLINSLVHDHGGHIQIDSTEGAGTCFTVYLPAATEEVAVVAEPVSLTLNGQIVVVDDEVSVGSFIGEILQDHGFEVAVYSDSPSALKYLHDNHERVAMLITDQSMPMLTGLDLVQALRELNPKIPAILITAFTGATDRSKLQDLGVEGFLAKPFRIADLLSAISRHGRHSHLAGS
ncbi:MAG: response regulator [Pseudomonadota bacterium]